MAKLLSLKKNKNNDNMKLEEIEDILGTFLLAESIEDIDNVEFLEVKKAIRRLRKII